jgi:hypothetical protein
MTRPKIAGCFVLLLAAASCNGSSPPPPPPPGTPPDLVNNPAADAGDETTQSESHVVQSGNVVVVGFNDSGDFVAANSFTGYAYSIGGAAFVDAGVLAPIAGGANSGDPALAVDGAGTIYFATLAGDATGASFIGVARSTALAPAVTFGAPVLIPGLDPNGFQDKELIAIDATGGANDGNIYVVWTEFFGNQSRILFSRSTDAGVTYAPAAQISTMGVFVSGAVPAVGVNGEVYVAWQDRSAAVNSTIRFRSSNDGGVTWSAEGQAAALTRIRAAGPTGVCGRNALNGNIRVNEFPSLDVDRSNGPNRGRIYITYSGDPNGNQNAGDAANVFVVSSADGGATWSPPVTVHQAPAATAGADATTNDNFFPWVSVSGDGAVHVSFYDRRNDPANLTIDTYRAVSTDGGVTWTNTRETPASFAVPVLSPNFDPLVAECYMGDYNGSFGQPNTATLTWGDNSRNITTPGFPGGRPDADVVRRQQP